MCSALPEMITSEVRQKYLPRFQLYIDRRPFQYLPDDGRSFRAGGSGRSIHHLLEVRHSFQFGVTELKIRVSHRNSGIGKRNPLSFRANDVIGCQHAAKKSASTSAAIIPAKARVRRNDVLLYSLLLWISKIARIAQSIQVP